MQRKREKQRERETTHALFCHFHQIVTISVPDGRTDWTAETFLLVAAKDSSYSLNTSSRLL